MSDKPESMLVADIGSVATKVGLVDRVGGEFRFVGMGLCATTAEAPFANVMVGVRGAVRQIEERTRRKLLTDDGELMKPERASGQGVDAFTAITSAALPLRVAVVGLSREVSIASAACAARGTYATVEATLALDETAGRWLRGDEPAPDGDDSKGSVVPARDPAAIASQALAHSEPDVIVLVGGVDGGAAASLYELANLVGVIAISRDEAIRPTVIFAGNREARSEIAARLGQVVSLRVADNVHPALDRENPVALQRELESLYVERQMQRLAGLGGLSSWTRLPVLPTAYAFETVVRFISRHYGLDVLGADVGATSTAIYRVHKDSITRVVRADLGVGYSVASVIAEGGAEEIAASLPLEMSPDALHVHYFDQALRPGRIPSTLEEARLQQAAAKRALAVAARDGGISSNTPDLVLMTGGVFSFNRDYGALALVALDALEPHGILTLAVDTLGLAPAFGALAVLNTEAAACVIERDAFVTLGTVIAPVSKLHEGQLELRAQVQPEDGGEINLEVAHGSLEVVPLISGQKATLQVHASKGVELGPGRHGLFKADVEGGTLGLVFDARGRPTALPASADKRREKIQQWYWDVGS